MPRGAACDERKMRAVFARHILFVEHPLHGASRQAKERLVDDGAIEPQVYGDEP